MTLTEKRFARWAFSAVLLASLAAPECLAATRSLGVCSTVEWRPAAVERRPGAGAFGPNHQAVEYMMGYEGRSPDIPPPETVRLAKGPAHGTLAPYTHPDTGDHLWRYMPDEDYIGSDRVEFNVQVGPDLVHVVYELKVTKLFIDDTSADRRCKKVRWRIS